MAVGSAKFGLMAAAGAGGPSMTAFGGIITQYEDSGTTYRVHTFRGSGKFVVSAGAADVDYLIVAGGGGGGTFGGPGAGGLLTGTGMSVDVASSPYTITVGTGGIGQTAAAATDPTADGNDSVALGVTVTGGGAGGGADGGTPANNPGRDGGSGGGVGYFNVSGGTVGTGVAGPPRQGYDGSQYINSSGLWGGGGGGAGEAGGTDGSGYGGDGVTGYGITATAPTYAGGGAGCADGTNPNPIGGTGGGGNGGVQSGTVGTGGVPNSGGGGGAGYFASHDGLDGGAGIVIIRYAVA